MTSTLAPSAPAGAFSPARRWAVLAVILAAEVLDLIDATITNLAAPTITASLGGGPSLVQWLGASYALALGVLLVVGGRLGDRYGRRRVFLVGLAGFTAASLACGLAVSPTMLVAARLVQGAFGALLIPQGFGILGAVFPRDQIGTAFSAFGPVLGLSAVGGPVLAATLIDTDPFGLGWRSLFLINIVLGGAGLVAAHRLLPRDTGERATVIDAVGSALLAGAMSALLYGLIDGSAHDWRTTSWVALGAAAILFALFARRQTTAPSPLIQPSLFRNRGFVSGLVLGIAFFAAVAGLLYVISLFLQGGLGYSPLRTALTGSAPVAVGIVIASIACHRLIGGLGRTLILIGLVTTLVGTLALWAAVHVSGIAVSPAVIAPAALVIGLGMGTCFGTVYDITLGDVTPAEAGSGSGSLTAVQQLANALGAAAVTTVYLHAPDQPAQAMTTSLLVVAAITLACCGLVRLLPRAAQPGHH
ncbi:drug resistance transporter, EmrB/QacA subfamily [Streptoalloteichus tenebrarius]|uniref:Drug resistance transporter, EmrB/QacA subfamily n=1 Tax=Streptoalloteichus tenebrarius (strain ATCC 17920 / DSM 40477 / JCM 4838 / CBS 697.72 / NBRC 16177 / NCIMB 11028 / NRRL B-12390 / A12253. 1 / ISP 5477) TaxID=1933 RepID=A0ABT1HQ74_STRSD|nr:MFS transporter [Streptoalloteichus tenebrarius]MCP2257666.1 drug resistance transporter, EmrB/QacA subfamily [Streptoalloteichus tenebrarius]BFE98627.1 MFS transporter [Streptoalloteichus tenebrarius]